MWPNPQVPEDFVTFAKEIVNGKLHFFVQCLKWWRRRKCWGGLRKRKQKFFVVSGKGFARGFIKENIAVGCTSPKDFVRDSRKTDRDFFATNQTEWFPLLTELNLQSVSTKIWITDRARFNFETWQICMMEIFCVLNGF